MHGQIQYLVKDSIHNFNGDEQASRWDHNLYHV